MAADRQIFIDVQVGVDAAQQQLARLDATTELIGQHAQQAAAGMTELEAATGRASAATTGMSTTGIAPLLAQLEMAQASLQSMQNLVAAMPERFGSGMMGSLFPQMADQQQVIAGLQQQIELYTQLTGRAQELARQYVQLGDDSAEYLTRLGASGDQAIESINAVTASIDAQAAAWIRLGDAGAVAAPSSAFALNNMVRASPGVAGMAPGVAGLLPQYTETGHELPSESAGISPVFYISDAAAESYLHPPATTTALPLGTAAAAASRLPQALPGQTVYPNVQGALAQAAALKKDLSDIQEVEGGFVIATGGVTKAADEAGAAAGRAGRNFGSWGGYMNHLVERMAFFAAAYGAIRFVESTMKDAEAVKQFGDETGITTDKLQALARVATGDIMPTGGGSFSIYGGGGGAGMLDSIKQVAGAVQTLDTSLASGAPKATTAIESLGLSIHTLLAESPDQRFIDVAQAIGEIPDPARRAELAVEVFGASGKTILPLMTGDVKDLVAQAEKIGPAFSGDAITAIEQLRQAWANAKIEAEGYIGSVFAIFGSASKYAGETFPGMPNATLAAGGPTDVISQYLMAWIRRNVGPRVGMTLPSLPLANAPTVGTLAGAPGGYQSDTATLRAVMNVLGAQNGNLGLSANQMGEIGGMSAYGFNPSEIAGVTGVDETTISLYLKQLAATTKQIAAEKTQQLAMERLITVATDEALKSEQALDKLDLDRLNAKNMATLQPAINEIQATDQFNRAATGAAALSPAQQILQTRDQAIKKALGTYHTSGGPYPTAQIALAEQTADQALYNLSKSADAASSALASASAPTEKMAQASDTATSHLVSLGGGVGILTDEVAAGIQTLGGLVHGMPTSVSQGFLRQQQQQRILQYGQAGIPFLADRSSDREDEGPTPFQMPSNIFSLGGGGALVPMGSNITFNVAVHGDVTAQNARRLGEEFVSQLTRRQRQPLSTGG